MEGGAVVRIPWLVQHHPEGATHAPKEWDTIIATTSAEAARQWYATIGAATYPLPMQVIVAPAAPCLHHPNGQPMFSRTFKVEAQQ